MNIIYLRKRSSDELLRASSGLIAVDLDTLPASVVCTIDATAPSAWTDAPIPLTGSHVSATGSLGWWYRTDMDTCDCAGFLFLSWGFKRRADNYGLYMVIDSGQLFWQLSLYTYSYKSSTDNQRITWVGRKQITSSDGRVTGTYTSWNQTDTWVNLTAVTPPIASPYFLINSATITLPA